MFIYEEKSYFKRYFFIFKPFCYEQTSPLARRKTRYGLGFLKPKLVARLLLSPLKSCDFRGPRKADFAFWGKGKIKQGAKVLLLSKTKQRLLCFDAVQLRVTQSYRFGSVCPF